MITPPPALFSFPPARGIFCLLFLLCLMEGSFEANPPFVEEVMERMVDHIHHLLERARGPMSFAVIVPGWDDDACMSYQKMKRSPFARPSPGVLPGAQNREATSGRYNNRHTTVSHLLLFIRKAVTQRKLCIQ